MDVITKKHICFPMILGFLLLTPSLIGGLQLDDYYHWGIVTNSALAIPGKDVAGIFGLFTFLDGDPQRTQVLIDKGMLPWWTLPELKYAFWRPVAEITHGIDYLLWPKQPMLMHLHSLVYLLLFLFATFKLLQRWLNGKALLWAFWIFSLSYTHGFAAGWLANRNAILASLFVALTLYFHDLWRNDTRTKTLIMALCCFALALLSGEMGVSAGLLLFAYAVCLERGVDKSSTLLSLWFSRLVTIVPYGLLGVLWLLARGLMGYGAEGSGHYVDPANLSVFFNVVSERYLQLFTAMFWSIPPEFSQLLGDVIPLIVTVLGGAMMIVVFAPIVKAEPLARFFVLGTLLLLLPVCATTPNSRLLISVSIPAAGLIGLYFSLRQQKMVLPGISEHLAKVLTVLLLVSMLGVSPLLSVLESVAMKLAMDGVLNQGAKQMLITDAQQDKIHVMINPPLSSAAGYIQGVRAYHGLPTAKAVIPLSSAIKPVNFERLSESEFKLESVNGLYQPHENLLRTPSMPLIAGQAIMFSGFEATIKSITASGYPGEVVFKLTKPMSDYVFHLWHGGEPVVCQLPSAGSSITLTQDRDTCAL